MATPLEKLSEHRASVRKAERVLAREVAKRDRAIARADRAGFSLREIAAASDVSHETVRTIVRKEAHRGR